ncbi:MAG: hypothetical protein KJO98_10305 [Rhodothermia bacterium]|nr:hypothetical protein [Rhodothermia bacterium]
MSATLLALISCDRPFVEISEPEIEIVEPDLSEVLDVTRIQMKVRASSFRPIDRVLLGDEPMEFDPETGLWMSLADLKNGLNELVVTAFDIDDVSSQDTAVAVVLSPQFTPNAPDLPRGIGDHAAILTSGGDLLVTGGAFQANGEALDVAFISSPAGAPFEELPSGLQNARLGHTMTNLPDGRVLIAGGTLRGTINDVLVLVTEAEVFDPSTREFSELIVAGDPIRRAHHSAGGELGSSGFILDLYGGRGDIRYRPQPAIGIRQDIRSFLLRNDSLISFTAAPGPFLGQPISGHTQVVVSDRDAFEPAEFLFHGTDFGPDFRESISFTVDFADPLGLIPVDAGKTQEARTHHVSVAVTDGLVITLGGSGPNRDAPLGSVELYVDRRREFLRVPLNQTSPLRRSGHSATKLSDGRIIIVGGFLTGGNSTSLSEYLLISTD